VRILIVKLSSLGDVVHSLPVVADIRRRHPQARIDWVVEPAFAPLLGRVAGIDEVIELPLRRWTHEGWLEPAIRREIAAFWRRLRRERYDAIVDLQGLTKSALVARAARGTRYGLANRTEGASHEWPARWLADHAIRVEPHSHALDRGRELVARALGTSAEGAPAFGLAGAAKPDEDDADRVVFIHGTTRADKLWPLDDWIELGHRVIASGLRVALPRADTTEAERALRIMSSLGLPCEIWPAMDLGTVVDRMAGAAGAIGVDSGLSHIAVALDLPHVQIYNHPTAWRTGPQARHGHRHQVSVEASPSPSVDAVWAAWQQVQPSGIAKVVAPDWP
jgi:heptosyltransferase-1